MNTMMGRSYKNVFYNRVKLPDKLRVNKITIDLSNEIRKQNIECIKANERQRKVKEHPIEWLKDGGSKTCGQIKEGRGMMSHMHRPKKTNIMTSIVQYPV